MTTPESLPALISKASARLLAAKDSAEVLEAKHLAEAALHYAKVTKAANETHADCLRMIMRAEMRMANEIDRGQANGEIAGHGGDRSKVRTPDLESLGVSKQRVAEWRQVRDAGPEKVEKAIANALKEGRAPTKNDIRRQVTLDPEFQAEAEAAARDIEIERDERIATSGAGALADENTKLTKQVSMLTRRIAGLLEEASSLKQQVKIWKERALSAGWKGRQNA